VARDNKSAAGTIRMTANDPNAGPSGMMAMKGRCEIGGHHDHSKCQGGHLVGVERQHLYLSLQIKPHTDNGRSVAHAQ